MMRQGPPAPSPSPSPSLPLADALALLCVPVACAVAALTATPATPALTLGATLVALASMAASIERTRPPLRQLMPTVVLAALAAAGRVLFAPLPDVKPVSAIAIVAGSVLGPRSGFAVGALAALTSNAFFGQGPWTPLQMYAWGLVGYLGGALARTGAFRTRRALYAYGLASGLLYGALLNGWHVLGFVRPLTWQATLVAFVAGLPWDMVHGVSTVAFLALVWEPWGRAIRRVVVKFCLREEGMGHDERRLRRERPPQERSSQGRPPQRRD